VAKDVPARLGEPKGRGLADVGVAIGVPRLDDGEDALHRAVVTCMLQADDVAAATAQRQLRR
jgi:hypothetical protein